MNQKRGIQHSQLTTHHLSAIALAKEDSKFRAAAVSDRSEQSGQAVGAFDSAAQTLGAYTLRSVIPSDFLQRGMALEVWGKPLTPCCIMGGDDQR